MVAVGNAAQQIVEEVRRQFREIPGILEGKGQPDYERCVAISTDSAIRQMLAPGIIAVAVPSLIAILTVLGRGNILSDYVSVHHAHRSATWLTSECIYVSGNDGKCRWCLG